MTRRDAEISGVDNARVLIGIHDLMEHICDPSNLNQAFRHVKRNKGSAGVDKLSIQETEAYLREGQHAEQIRNQLLEGDYRPALIRGVRIPKSSGGERQLGIPTVLDRWIQQAMLQILTKIYDPQFSDSSFGFRHKRKCA
ncbi:reverse transcriptase domain-containing protein [Marinibactrum halimedae]|uniref:Group II intron reverse transcriptase/maturase n=1 Tax=Marinibactrum halimedae TaxID=1444977 RepID=A0AA37WQ97_9GAMM|nr:reverse transcriptase domain-containing protein [Marinibactrum halimedae]MCD9458939.1 hypothetical protein [Marinibactrum halimedae]GLS26932.1 hypothetical protein GCM10007877_26510 [Marinibactrum halimedae]